MGIPTDMFTVIFAIPRTSGWIAQWMEQNEDPELKIARPRQIYTGRRDVDYTPLTSATVPRRSPGRRRRDRRSRGAALSRNGARVLSRNLTADRGISPRMRFRATRASYE